MQPLYSASVVTDYGEKSIELYQCDILNFDEPVDILTTSAYVRSYAPTPNTMFAALQSVGISVEKLADRPAFDLRRTCGVWLSDPVQAPDAMLRRIGCVELLGYRSGEDEVEQAILTAIRAYFAMLDLASIYGVAMDTVALPLIGTGSQRINQEMMIVPLLNECVSFLKRNQSVRRICFVERSTAKAELILRSIQNSYTLFAQTQAPAKKESEPKQLQAFISYSTPDRNIADNLCAKLESRGIKVWYAPRNVVGPYAEAICEGIDRSAYFIVILSQSSIRSQHVLNEIDLAFQNLPNKIRFKPLRIDDAAFTPSFKYYLSRQHWMDAIDPPLEKRLNEFVDGIVAESQQDRKPSTEVVCKPVGKTTVKVTKRVAPK